MQSDINIASLKDREDLIIKPKPKTIHVNGVEMVELSPKEKEIMCAVPEADRPKALACTRYIEYAKKNQNIPHRFRTSVAFLMELAKAFESGFDLGEGLAQVRADAEKSKSEG